MPLRPLGVALLVVGVILLIFGISSSESISSSFSEFFTGKPTDKTVWLLIGAAAALIVGASLSFSRGRGAA